MDSRYEFLSPEFYLQDQDAQYARLLDRVSEKPVVFIMGLHRSGTTYTLQTLHDVLGAASLSVHDIAFYRQRIFGRLNGLERQQVDQIKDYFGRYGLVHRPIDKVPLSPDTLDEYGFIYRRLGAPQNFILLEEIIKKLSYLYSNAPVVLLKEPSMFAMGGSLIQTFAKAKLIYVHRNPIKTMVSRYRSIIWRRSWRRDWAYQHLLTGRPASIPAKFNSLFLPRLGKAIIAKKIAKGMVASIRDYKEDLLLIPSSQILHFEFEDLLESPKATIGRIMQFLDLPAIKSLDGLRASPRKPIDISTEVDAVAHRLCDTLHQIGYEHSSLEE